jgi:hypothetical protein
MCEESGNPCSDEDEEEEDEDDVNESEETDDSGRLASGIA